MRRRCGYSRFSMLLLAGMALGLALACQGRKESSALPYGPAALPSDVPAAVKQAAGTTVDPAVVAADTGLGLALFNQVRQDQPGANLFVSPFSLAMCLDMIYNGAAGQTRSAMAQAMQMGAMTTAQLNAGKAALVASLLTADFSVQLETANGIWARQTILPAFLATNQTYYGATLGTLDGAPGTVNAWVNQKTQGRIPTLLDPALDCASLDAILVNAIYFKGSWTSAFTASATATAPFTRQDGTQVSCPMMAHQVTMGCRTTALGQAGQLTYGDGRFAFAFLLPPSGVPMASAAAGLDAASWQALFQDLPAPLVALRMPRFKATWSAPLQAPLTRLGMGLAFDQTNADFSAMATRPEYLDFVIQSTTVEVDETGTVATAATGGGMAPTVMPVPVEVNLDRPFFYAIRDTLTGELLFFGQMMDPAAG